MFLERQVGSDSPALDPVFAGFHRNLEDICRSACRAGAKVIVSNVPVNLRDCPPFASRHRRDLSSAEQSRWEAAYREGVACEAEGLGAKAMESYREATAIDDSFADLQFRLARIAREAGEPGEARQRYALALEHDALRFRADRRINAVIRDVASDREQEGIFFTDAIAAFEAASPDGIPGAEFFYEHVHPTFEGNYLLAASILETIREVLPPDPSAPAAPPTLAEVQERLAFTEFDRFMNAQTILEEYLTKPPFTGQLDHPERIAAARTALEALRQRVDVDACLRHYTRAGAAHPDDWRLLVEHYELLFGTQGERDLDTLEAMLRRIIAVHPHDKAFHTLGKILLLQGRLTDAEGMLAQALALNPASGKALHSLAILALRRNDTAAVIRHLERSLALEPADSAMAYRLLATEYDKADRTDQAIEVLLRALAIFPDDESALLHCHAAELLAKRGQGRAALEHLETALRVDPSLDANPAFVHQRDLIQRAIEASRSP